MIKIVFFDLDGTLSPVGKAADEKTVTELHKLYKNGVIIAFCSGKPVAYLNGYARQIGVPNAIMIGESGAEWQFGIDLPPKYYGKHDVPTDVTNYLTKLKADVIKKFGSKIWIQPNFTEFTVFPLKEEYFPELREYFEQTVAGHGLDIYYQPDCFDILPTGINKGEAVKNVLSILHIKKEDSSAIGDGINDESMLKTVGLPISVKEKFDIPGIIYAENCAEAIKTILNY